MTMASEFVSPSDLVRAARKSDGWTQSEFASFLGSRQSLISKYERGLVNPPAALVMQCMNILNRSDGQFMTQESLVQLIRERLSGAEHAAARAAIASLVSEIR